MREDDIRKLCECVLETMLSEHQNQYNYRVEYACPLCGVTIETWDNKVLTMDTFKHNVNCGYLIAKDLMTNMTKE